MVIFLYILYFFACIHNGCLINSMFGLEPSKQCYREVVVFHHIYGCYLLADYLPYFFTKKNKKQKKTFFII